MGWRELLGLGPAAAVQDGTRTEVVQRIAEALDALPPARARFVAAFAYHLGRVAHADHALSGDERAVIRTLVATESGLAPEQVDVVVDLVVRESLQVGGTEDYRVMREFDEVATPEQKVALIRCLFAVSAADEQVVTKEDNEIRRIAVALKVPHGDFVAARTTVRQHLAVLRRAHESA